jgi:hypothetical protein
MAIVAATMDRSSADILQWEAENEVRHILMIDKHIQRKTGVGGTALVKKCVTQNKARFKKLTALLKAYNNIMGGLADDGGIFFSNNYLIIKQNLT